MNNNNIYFDTEFEGLFINAGLISVGFSDSTGQNVFYAEFSNTYDYEKCSQFCKSRVIPLLEGGSVCKTLEQVRIELFSWMKDQGSMQF